WILDALCREIARFFPGTYTFHYSLRDLPDAAVYYVSHYSLVPELLKRNPKAWDSRIVTWYTHPKKYSFSDAELVYALNRVDKVIATNSAFAARLVRAGVAPEKVTYVLGGADPDFFRPHERGNGCVGLCSAYYPRK